MQPDDLEKAKTEQCRGEADGDLAGAGGSADEPDGADDPERPGGGEECCADDPASQCQITLGTTGTLLELTIADDGSGPAPPDAPGRGDGLESMRERATELGGSFTIEARPAGGTLVRALLPVSPLAATENTPAPPASATDTGTRHT